jgi:hypothetical protein
LYACAVISTIFAGAYWLSNELTSLRADVGAGVYAWDRQIPFVPWTIVPYLSIVVFFLLSFFVHTDRIELQRHVNRLLLVLLVSLACYALFPLRFTLERPPVGGIFEPIYGLLAACDRPYNRAPSLHISTLVVLWARFAPCLSPVQRACLQTWFLLIAGSVLTTYQHHVIDIPGGVAVGIVAVFLTSPSISEAASRIFTRRLAA